MNSFVYPRELNIIAKADAVSAATSVDPPHHRSHFDIRPFSDTACRAATVPEIDKILLSG